MSQVAFLKDMDWWHFGLGSFFRLIVVGDVDVVGEGEHVEEKGVKMEVVVVT